jgi:hypothetical protein
VALLSFAPLMFADPAHAVPVPATITCSDSMGNSASWNVQWDNSNQYFSDKGDIAAHFCEGGYGGDLRVFAGVVGPDGAEINMSLRYFNGVIPEPEVIEEPAESTADTERTTEDADRVTEEVVRQPDTAEVERATEEVVREPEAPQPAQPEPVQTEPEPPIVEPEPEPTPESPVEPVEPTEPEVEESVQPEPVEPPMEPTEPEISPEEPVLPEPEEPQSFSQAVEAIGEAISETFESAVEAVGQVVEAFQTAGLDMTQEERKTAQSVVVPSVIVAQIATLTFRK